VRGRECFVKIEVDDIKAHVAWSGYAKQGVHVGAVHVKEAAVFVDHVGYGNNLFFKQADGVGVGEHQCGNIPVEFFLEVVEVCASDFVAFYRHNRVSGKCGGGRVGAVGRIDYKQCGAFALLSFVIFFDKEYACQFSVCTGRGLQGDGCHSCDFSEHSGEFVHKLKGSLDGCFWLHRVQGCEPFERAGFVVDFRVVLHGAASKRVHVFVDMVIKVGEPDEMTDHFAFGYFGKFCG